MPHALRLEEFETPELPDGPVVLMPEDVETLKLNAYERGYAAGWEDGGQSVEADEAARRAAFARQAEHLNFTYHEARGHVLAALKPLFTAMLEGVLPVAARASVVPLVIEQLLPLANAAAETPITLRVARGMQAEFEAAFAGQVLPPLDLVETDDLAEGEAEFHFEALHTRIDLDHAVEAIRRAIARFYMIQTEESRRA
jgi:flagellar assembly protein FliH